MSSKPLTAHRSIDLNRWRPARTRAVRGSLVPAALAHSTSFRPATAVSPQPGGQLHQRRRVRHRPVQAGPAGPPSGDRITDLRAQALIAQPVPELEEHQPHVALDRRSRPDWHQMKVRRERGKNTGSASSASTRASSSGSRSNPAGSRHSTATDDCLSYGTRWPRPLLAQEVEAILSHRQRSRTRQLFQVEIT